MGGSKTAPYVEPSRIHGETRFAASIFSLD
jgi:hypothetical protein